MEDIRLKQNTIDAFFLYLKNLLYAPNKATINIEEIDEEAQLLGQGLLLIGEYLQEQRTIATALSKGDLTIKASTPENTLVAPLLAIQSSLRHMTWQTQQVAKGDYGQSVDFMGGFSEAFNSMIEQLKAREDELNKHMELLENNNIDLQNAHESFLFLLENSKDSIVVFDLSRDTLSYENESAHSFFEKQSGAEDIFLNQFRSKLLRNEAEGVWEFDLNDNGKKEQRYFEVTSYKSPWNGTKAIVCIIRDITEIKKELLKIKKISYQDSLTGLYNRRYALQEMERLAKNNISFAVAFIDIDYLKYCNDEYGHECGDQYIVSVAKCLEEINNIYLNCRIGGDEFLVISTLMTEEELKEALEEARTNFTRAQNKTYYPKNFSYGVSEVSESNHSTVTSAMKEADQKMYQFKLENKSKSSKIESVELSTDW
ncbi:MAG: diguanylate cyclase domain-containing protein [Lachnospiraceae bacterium]